MGIWIGDRDRLVPLEPIEKTRDMFSSQGFPATFKVMKGHDHDYYSVSKTLNQEVWDYLSKVENKEPSYEEYLKP